MSNHKKPPFAVCLMKDGRLRVGDFMDASGLSYFSDIARSATNVVIKDDWQDAKIRYYVWSTKPKGPVRSNRAFHALIAALAKHAAFDKSNFLVLDEIGVELIKRMVTD